MVPDTPDVISVLFSDGGVVEGLGDGKLIIDMSSTFPIETRNFTPRIKAMGCEHLDASVYDGKVGTKAALLTIMVGGAEKTFQRSNPLFELMGRNVTFVGANGDSQTCKVPNQIIDGSPSRP